MQPFNPKQPKKIRSLEYYLRKMERQIEFKGRVARTTRIIAQAVYARENGVCDNCGSEDRPTADHIVPVAMLAMLGFDMEHEFRLEWLQVLCYQCNNRKGCKLDWNNWRTEHILNRAIKEAYETRKRTNRQSPVPEVPAPIRLCELPLEPVG